jgi:nucleotide-binding universal stress UspA family protein
VSAYRRILVAVDGSAASARGLREALRLARGEDAELCILHVVNEAVPYTPLAGAPPINLIPLLVESGRALLEKARKQRADLIVLGSDAEQVVRTASVPVLLVRSPS